MGAVAIVTPELMEAEVGTELGEVAPEVRSVPPRVSGEAHANSHHVVALDERGVLLGSASFSTRGRGYGLALVSLEKQWSSGRGRGRVSTGSCGAGLVRNRNHPIPHLTPIGGPIKHLCDDIGPRHRLSLGHRADPGPTRGWAHVVGRRGRRNPLRNARYTAPTGRTGEAVASLEVCRAGRSQ